MDSSSSRDYLYAGTCIIKSPFQNVGNVNVPCVHIPSAYLNELHTLCKKIVFRKHFYISKCTFPFNIG